MVSIGKLGRRQARYYIDQASHARSAAAAIASGIEDYYTGGVEAAGSWLGTGSRRLGLRGAVRDEELQRVLAGQRPREGELLRLRSSVPGFDVTFSAPKSVSLLFGIGDARIRDAVLAAHGRAVVEGFSYLERSTAVGRRGAGGVNSTWGDGLVAAAFLHRTSRAGDPQLHTHVLLANLVRGADGRWTALDARVLYAHGRTAGYLYQAALRDELSRSLGVRWTPTQKGAAEIEGMPRRVLAAFSRRRTEIEAAMATAGAVGPEAARVATFATRRAKDYRVRPELLVDEWRERAAQLGLGRLQLTRLLGRMQPVRLDSDDWTQLFDELAGPTGLTARKSTFTRPDILRAIAERLPQGAPVRTIEEAADGFLRSSCAVRLLVPRDALQHPVAIRRQDGRQVALHMYSQRGRLVAGERGDDVMRRLVADWHAAGNADTSVMIAHSRRDVADLNGRARALMRADGRLGDQQLYLPGGPFSTGDQVVIKLNDSRLRVRNSDRGVIVDVDLAARTLDVRLSNATVRLPRSFLERTTSRGDPTLVHGYAITAYVSQGMTCERAYVFARDDAYREWVYATMTRARSASRLYVVAERASQRDEFAPTEPARDARAALAAALSRSDERRFASEHIERGSDRTRGIDR